MERPFAVTALALAALVLSPASATGAEPAAAAWLAPTTPADLALPTLDPALPSPVDHLGHPLGERFHDWNEALGYLHRLAAASERVTIEEIGRTYEDRPLVLLSIADAEVLARGDEIRRRRLADVADPPPSASTAGDDPAIVWLGYGVHGDEASSMEAALATAYVLAAARGEAWDRVRRSVLVLLDPLSNPDGRERYTGFYRATRGRVPDPDPTAAEHRQPWPGGRGNHYLVDLNRDWAWATQRETRARLAAWLAWRPHVTVDLHEMRPAATYFFPPPARPVHPGISGATRHWLERFGTANAAAFDARGWLYFARDGYDLFYPGYGDSYPALAGAVGMTYEMAGGGRAGLAYRRSNGSILTLADRVARHLVASLTTVETAAAAAPGLHADLAAERRRQLAEPATTYLWEPGGAEAEAVVELLARHGIAVGTLGGETLLEAAAVTGGEPERRRFPAGTLLASTRQPGGELLRTLVEPETPLPAEWVAEQRRRVERRRRTELNDVTAWGLPLSFGVPFWRLAGEVPPERLAAEVDPFPAGGPPAAAAPGGGRPTVLGFAVEPSGLAGYRFATRLLADGRELRWALEPFSGGARTFPAGTLFVPAGGDPAAARAELVPLAAEAGVELLPVAGGLPEAGVPPGAPSAPRVRPSRIGLVGGAGTSATSFGHLWHLLDVEIGVALRRIDGARLDAAALSHLDVLLLPDGEGWGEDEERGAAIRAWVERGGVLVAIGEAARWAATGPGRGAGAAPATGEAPAGGPDARDAADPGDLPDRSMPRTPGAALAARLSPGHPLATGLAAPPAVLYRGRRLLPASGDASRDVLVVDPDDPVAAGLVWPEAAERLAGTLLVGTEPLGDGLVVLFATDPAFRLFWRSTMPLVLNAAVFGPTLAEAERR